MANWYTADPHFGDDGVRRFYQRPFASTAAMDEAMIRHAACVAPKDDFWIIGDFADDSAARRDATIATFDRLPGRKHLVRGNHDPDWLLDAVPWASTHQIVEVQDGDQLSVLCHYPLLTWNHARAGAINLSGHVHVNWAGSANQVNVGVDCWNFAPVSRRDALLRCFQLPENALWQQTRQA